MMRIAALLLILAAGPATAQTQCAAAIAQFQGIIDSDVKVGHLNKSVYNRILPELNRASETCRAGHDAEAMRALGLVKHRHGYR
jgi:hypothetical protein